jgi:uncharacterized damage-inducible protein DinB
MQMQSLLDETREAWAYARKGIIAELRNMPQVAFDIRPVQGVRTVAEIAWHIAGSGMMMAGELTRPDGDFTRKSFSAFMKEYARGVGRYHTKARIIALLTRSHADGDRRIRMAGELFMLQRIRRFDGVKGTRLAWMHHHIAHEEYHRGQLALRARLLGKVPVLTTRLDGP